MNKLTKIGASALCGSLAAFSTAIAGDLTVTGGADMTWMSKSNDTTGNPLGVGSDFAFAGSGELDNGWTVSLSIAHTNAGVYSNTSVTVGVPGIGDIKLNQGGSGTGIQRMDDMSPTVWEEADGAGLAIGATKIAGSSAGATIQVENFSLMPDGLAAVFAYSPDSDGSSSTSDKTTGGDSGTLGSGWDLTLTATEDFHTVSGLTVYGGISQVDQYQETAGINGDSSENVFGVKYAWNSLTVGWQQSDDDTGRSATNTNYEHTAWGVTFQVNDDLSLGYGEVESTRTSTTNVTAKAESIQVAYTMGGASLRVANIKADNIGYSAADDKETNVISLGLAF